MSKKVNPTAVGIFVTGAIVLLVAGLFVLGSSELFETRKKFVVYFRSSANGLSENSAVKLGGVKVGTVVKMWVQFDPKTNERVIPVVIELSADRISALSADHDKTKDNILSRKSMEDAIKRGLRARLKSQSALTGQLFVDLEFLPEDHSGYEFPGETIEGLTQIPSVKNQIEQVLEQLTESLTGIADADIGGTIKHLDDLIVNLDGKVSELNLKGISESANNTLANIDKVVSEADFKGFFEKLDNTVGTIDKAVGDIDRAMTEGDLKGVIANLNDATADLKELTSKLDDERLNEAVENAALAMDRIQAASANVARLTNPEGVLAARLTRTLEDLNGTARSLRELADYLKRNPNALITGKKAP